MNMIRLIKNALILITLAILERLWILAWGIIKPMVYLYFTWFAFNISNLIF